ncbi:MAG: hypothetical protein EZS28_014239 [Streblomastix strix]|uniref:Uncharacterized protein n=1 Tax=Streblomastix strix TaxID=222440 RepID=A0A5J4W632_9EUKA|nr:MAG: hypothetical protein EZS28_014239 [Streblomastix strix]
MTAVLGKITILKIQLLGYGLATKTMKRSMSPKQIGSKKTAVPTRGPPRKVDVNGRVVPIATAERSLIPRQKDATRPIEHIEYAELFRSNLFSYVHGIILAKSLSEIFAIYGYSVISGWSDGKIRSFGPESGRMQHVIGDVHKKVSSVSTFQNSSAIVSGVSEGQICLWKFNRDNQQIVATRKEYVVALTAVCNAGRS